MEKVLQATEVTIFGQKYAIKSECDQPFMSETASMVNRQMREISDRTSTLPALKVAILASMNLAGEYLKLKKEHQRLRQEVAVKTSNILSLIDNRLR